MADRYYKANRLTLQPVPGVGIVVINKGETGRLPEEIGDRLVVRKRVTDDGAATDKKARTGIAARRDQRSWRERSESNDRPVKGVERPKPERTAAPKRRKSSRKKASGKAGTSTRSRAGKTATRAVTRTPAAAPAAETPKPTTPTVETAAPVE